MSIHVILLRRLVVIVMPRYLAILGLTPPSPRNLRVQSEAFGFFSSYFLF
jgi:hypothetical protein